MKGVAGRQHRGGLPLGATMICADNSGAKMISLIDVKAYHALPGAYRPLA